MTMGWLVGVAGAVAVVGVAGGVTKGPMKTFTLRESGVSLEYPAVWVEGSNHFSMGPQILLGPKPAQLDVHFSPVGNVYEKTNLAGLELVYVWSDAESAEECKAAALKNANNVTPAAEVKVQGGVLQHAKAGDAGMCHQVQSDVYWTYRGKGEAGGCDIFETDLQTICPGVKDDQRALTATETKALQRHLAEAVESIRFTK